MLLFEAAPWQRAAKYIWRNKNMNKSKGMQLGAMLAAMLLMSIAFVAGTSVDSPTSASWSTVSEKKALEHSTVYMLHWTMEIS